ncbi:hypothetical protein Hanom_Chr04g00291961 [Helianthus anomalus]
MNEKLSEEMKTLKKNELREEELVLKAEKAKMEQQVKSMAPHPAACHRNAKMYHMLFTTNNM